MSAKTEKNSEENENCTVRYSFSEYHRFAEAFDFYNARLFDGKLPEVVFTMPRHRGAAGYFRPESFVERQFDKEGNSASGGFKVHEIAMMPDAMWGCSDKEVLSTLVHEMCHLWQQEYGEKMPRKCYHNREFAEKMKKCGLQTSTTGEQGGAETGQKMTHYIIEKEIFDKITDELLATGFSLNLCAIPKLSMPAKKSKFKYSCPKCKQNAWAKSEAALACSNCGCSLVFDDEEE